MSVVKIEVSGIERRRSLAVGGAGGVGVCLAGESIGRFLCVLAQRTVPVCFLSCQCRLNAVKRVRVFLR